MDREFLEGRIAACKSLVVVWDAALTQLALADGIQSYTVDTGQTRQVVTRSDIGTINRIIDGLLNRCATMQARLDGSGVLNARPGW